jgi:4-amino-4-deoxy-L-arabinose transferase-like glycosyltransferase
MSEQQEQSRTTGWMPETTHDTVPLRPTIRTSALLHPALLVGALTLLALGVRIARLAYRGPSSDEFVTLLITRASPVQIYTDLTALSVHPPLYYIFTHLWMQIVGFDIVSARLFSVVAGAACVPLTYLLGRMVANSRVGLVAALLMALSPFVTQYSQQARMYPLLALLVLLTVLSFIEAWRKGGWLRWLGVGLCAIAGIYTHIYYPLSLLGLNLWAVADALRQRQFDRARWTGLIVSQLIATLLFLPFLPSFFGTVGTVVESFWIEADLGFYWIQVLANLTTNVLQLRQAEAPLWLQIGIALVTAGVLLLGLGYSLRETRRHPAEQSSWLLLHLLVWTPIVAALLITLFITPIMVDRYFIALAAPLYLLVAWMVVRFWQQRIVQALMVLLLLSNVVVLVGYTYPAEPNRSHGHQAVQYIGDHWQPGDAVICTVWTTLDPTVYVYPNRPGTYVSLGPPNANTEQRMRHLQQRINYYNLETAPTIAPIDEIAAQHERVWLMLNIYDPLMRYYQNEGQAQLAEHGTLVEEVLFANSTGVYLYDMHPDRDTAPESP